MASTHSRIDYYYRKLLQAKRREDSKNRPLVTCDILEFCERLLGFKLTQYQKKFLLDGNQFAVARWARQTGKSTTISTLCLYTALSTPGYKILVVAPGLRQGRKMVHRIASLIPKLGFEVLQGKPLKGKLDFVNGSSIEAFPNNPETIRGETSGMVVADELAFIKNDRELYDSIVYSLASTGGRFIGSSTPGAKDNLFYEMNTNDELYGDFSRQHVSWKEAVEPKGPLKKDTVEKVRRQMGDDPARWQREMEAEFADNDDTWLSKALIHKCVSKDLPTYDQSVILAGSTLPLGTYYIGCDLGQKRDPSAIVVLEKKEGHVYLVHSKTFKLGAEYGSVLGYLKILNQKFKNVPRINIDQTGVGQVFVEDAIRDGLKNVVGVTLTLPTKQEIMVYLKNRMEEGLLHIPHDLELIMEMNLEKVELMQTGQRKFSNPDGTHDDRLWALALGVYASRTEITKHRYFAVGGRIGGQFTPVMPKLRPVLTLRAPWIPPIYPPPPGR